MRRHEVLISAPALIALLTCLMQCACADDNEIVLCGDTDYYNVTDLPYSFSNNAWGDDGSGFSCLHLAEDSTNFSVVYQWTDNYYNVHGFPHVKLEDARLPLQLSELRSLNFDGAWSTYVEGTNNESSLDQAIALHKERVRSNVAIDMFLDSSVEQVEAYRPAYEIMIWMWSSKGIAPVGSPSKDSNGSQIQYEISGQRFYLYEGFNPHGQHTFSWLSSTNITAIAGDFLPLLQYLWELNMISTELFIGVYEFGSENFYASEKAVFEVTRYNMSISTTSDTNGTSAPLPPLQIPSPVPKNAASLVDVSDNRVRWLPAFVLLTLLWQPARTCLL